MDFEVRGRRGVDAAAAATMVFLTFCWGFNQVAIKVSAVGYNPVFLSVTRSLLALALVLAWCAVRRIPLFERDGTLWGGLLAGALFGIEFTLIFFGLDFTSAARAVLMINTMPFMVLIGAHFWLGERISAGKFWGLVLAFAGVALVFSDELSLPGPDALLGDILCLCAGAAWAATTLVIKTTRLATASAEKTLVYQLAVGALVTAPLLPFAGPLLREPSWLATGSLVFQAAFVVSFTYLVWFWLLRRYSATGLSSFAFLSPVFGVLCGGLLLGEPLGWRIFVALGLIAAGLVVVNRVGRGAA